MIYTLITGAGSGIGRAIAIELSKISNLILLGRNSEKLNNTKELCSNKFSHLTLPCDLNDLENLEDKLINFIKDNNLIISKFVHSAGFMKMLPLKSLSLDDINTTLNTNLISPSLIVKTLSNRKHNQASLENVVFISSNISNMGAKAFSIYGASKAGLDGLMRSLAVELGPKIRVNSVLPGGVKTEMTQHIYENEEVVKRMSALYPLGLGEAQNIADAVCFLLSEKSSWITGQQIIVDGGRSINITG